MGKYVKKIVRLLKKLINKIKQYLINKNGLKIPSILTSDNFFIVISRYKENINWVNKIPWPYIIYNKGQAIKTNNKNIIESKNIGREAETYLKYIISNYNNLSNFTVFLQGNPFDHSNKLFEKIKLFDGIKDISILSDQINYEDRKGQPNHPGLKTGESSDLLFENKKDTFEYTPGAQFIVSKKLIQNRPLSFYQFILNEIETNAYINKCEVKSHRPTCNCGTRFSPWVLERLWLDIFDIKQKSNTNFTS